MLVDVYSSKNKRVVKDTETGKTREINIGSREREIIARGDLTQPVGRDKGKFFRLHPDLYEDSKGVIKSKNQERRQRQIRDENEELQEKVSFKNQDKIHKKYY